jgi:hypothetical protein
MKGSLDGAAAGEVLELADGLLERSGALDEGAGVRPGRFFLSIQQGSHQITYRHAAIDRARLRIIFISSVY